MGPNPKCLTDQGYSPARTKTQHDAAHRYIYDLKHPSASIPPAIPFWLHRNNSQQRPRMLTPRATETPHYAAKRQLHYDGFIRRCETLMQRQVISLHGGLLSPWRWTHLLSPSQRSSAPAHEAVCIPPTTSPIRRYDNDPHQNHQQAFCPWTQLKQIGSFGVMWLCQSSCSMPHSFKGRCITLQTWLRDVSVVWSVQ